MHSTRLRIPIYATLIGILAAAILGLGGVTAAEANIKLSDRAVLKRDHMILDLRNTATSPLRATVSAVRGKRQVGRASLQVPARSKRSLRLRLKPGLARKIKKQGKVRLSLVLRVRVGNRPERRMRRGVTVVGSRKTGGGNGSGKPDGPAAPPLDGQYKDSAGWTMAVEDGVVKGFSGSISTYCTVTRRQKTVYFAMIGEDPSPRVAADGSYSWEATRGYGFVKLKFEGRIVNGKARGKMMVEDRSMILGSGRIEFDYCFAGREYELTRESNAKRAAAVSSLEGPGRISSVAGRSGRRAKPARWKISRVKLDGWSHHRFSEGDERFEAKGRIAYRTKGRLAGPPADLSRRRIPLATPLSTRGITWTGYSDATLSTATGSWSCSHNQRPIRAGLAGSFTVLAKRVRVQWSLAPTLLRCPEGAPKWSFPGLPLAAMTSTFPSKLLRGRSARIPVDIQHRWSDDAGSHEVHWDGFVHLKRVGR